MTARPEGFEPHTRRSGLTDPWQPIYARPSDRGVKSLCFATALALADGSVCARASGVFQVVR